MARDARLVLGFPFFHRQMVIVFHSAPAAAAPAAATTAVLRLLFLHGGLTVIICICKVLIFVHSLVVRFFGFLWYLALLATTLRSREWK